jgi:hypothetical protein
MVKIKLLNNFTGEQKWQKQKDLQQANPQLIMWSREHMLAD